VVNLNAREFQIETLFLQKPHRCAGEEEKDENDGRPLFFSSSEKDDENGRAIFLNIWPRFSF
jgi:hypothetical protein